MSPLILPVIINVGVCLMRRICSVLICTFRHYCRIGLPTNFYYLLQKKHISSPFLTTGPGSDSAGPGDRILMNRSGPFLGIVLNLLEAVWYNTCQMILCEWINKIPNKKHLKNVGPIRYCEPPLHCQSPGVACQTPAIAIAQAACDVHDDDSDNAWQRGPLWPHGMGPITSG